MKVKKFIASSMPEAMKQIRAELGPDAVILNSKVINKNGLFGFFQKKQLEVIAAIDPQPAGSAVLNAKQTHKSEKRIDAAKAPIKPNSAGNIIQDDGAVSPQALLHEIQEIKKSIENKAIHINLVNYSVPDPFSSVFERLMNHEIQQDILEYLAEDAKEIFYERKGNVSSEEASQIVGNSLKKMLEPIPFGGLSLKKKFINVIGPTGVGKTTTLAKIAAYSSLTMKKKIAFITTDTFRIGAVDQLKTYAKILNVPVEVCYNSSDFKNAVNKFSAYDIVYIDTAGRNYRNEQFVKDLSELIDFNSEMETFLVFSLTAKEKDMQDIYTKFSTVPIDKFIFTKFDETTRYGSLLNLTIKYKKGIAYIANGQDVPDDIIEGSATWVIDQILGDEGHE